MRASASDVSATIDRGFAATISGRQQIGPFGAGWQWSNGFGLTLAKLPDGSIAINGADGAEIFQPYGTYISLASDGSTLRANGDGSFTFVQPNGSVVGFAADGTESYLQQTDGNGNRVTITAGYTGGWLTSLTDSSGAALQILYNSAGRIATVESSTGTTATYAYDATNTYLESVSGPGGTTSYAYAPVNGAPGDNALLSMQRPDGRQDLYGYDSLGVMTSFRSGYAVSGQVTDGSGSPVAGATVTFYSEANPRRRFTAVTGADGSYATRTVPAGSYDVVVLADGFLADVETGVKIAGPTSGASTTLAASGTKLTGTVVDASGQAIAGATVTIVDDARRTIGTAVSAADGSFAITTASGNNLTLQIVVPGSNSPKEQTVTIPVGTTVQLGPIDPDGPGWLSQIISGEKSRSPDEVQRPIPPLTALCCASAQARLENAIDVQNSAWDDYDTAYHSLIQQAEADALVLGAQVAIAAGKAAQLYLGLKGVEGIPTTLIGVASTIQSNINALEAAPTLSGAVSVLNAIVGDAGKLVSNLKALGTVSGLVGLAQAIYNAGNTLLDSLTQLETAGLTANHDYQRYLSYVAQANAASLAYEECLVEASSNGGQCKKPPPPPSPPPPAPVPPPAGGQSGGAGNTAPVGSHDPNGLFGPAGFGPSSFVADDALLPYQIAFENAATATAPAQSVTISNQLDPNLDGKTFQLTGIGFGFTNVTVPAGLQSYQTTVSTTENGQTFDVVIGANLNPATGLVTVNFQSIDPSTHLPPTNPLTGFLPPEDGTLRGEGFVSYIVAPKTDLRTGTQIRNVALISFDGAPTIATDQVNDDDPSQGTDLAKQAPVTIDAMPPTSSVTPLPANVPSPSFTVNWSGSDDAGGSGVATFDVFVSDNGGTFTAFQTATTAASGTFNGVSEHTYAFYSVAADNVGNRQGTPTAAQTTTTVTPLPTSSVAPLAAASPASFTVSWSGSDVDGPGLATFDVFVSDDGGPFTAFQIATTVTSATFKGVNGHTYGFYSVATDTAGNRQPTPTAAQASTTVSVIAVLPTSSVAALAPTSPASFTVSWSGSDVGGPGLATFDVFVSDDGGPFTAFQIATTATSATFHGVNGHTYGFYSVATDTAGNRQPTPASAQASTTVVAALPAPLAKADTFVLSRSTTSGGSGATSVLANDMSTDGQPQKLTATLVAAPTHGTLLLDGDGSFSYIPGPTFHGIDRFSYQASESGAAGNTVDVSLLSYHASLVDKLYQQVLHRPAEDGGLIFWTDLLDRGSAPDVVAEGIFNSRERLDLLVGGFYEKYLGRAPDAVGLAAWVADWQQKGDPDEVVVNILASAEFYHDAGNTHQGFVSLLYQRFLDRAPDAHGLLYWTGLLDSGEVTTGEVAALFRKSPEQHADLVDFLFGEYFGNPNPTAGKTEPYVALLNTGHTQTEIEQAIIDSPEYSNTPPVPALGKVSEALYPR